MRILALDVGEKRIGIAITDALGVTAQPLKTVEEASEPKAIAAIDQTVDEYSVERIVVGLPLNMNGTESAQTQAVQRFIEKLEKRFRRRAKIIPWDERLSTVGAERSLLEADLSRRKRRKVVDKMSAVFILQGYLESQSQENA